MLATAALIIIKINMTTKEKKILLRLVCEDAQKQTDNKREVTTEMYNLRYKLRDSYSVEIKDIVKCKHKNETTRQGNGFVYVVCEDCGDDL